MTDDINPDFKEANAAIEGGRPSSSSRKIVELFGKWEEVRPSYILETALLELSGNYSRQSATTSSPRWDPRL